MCQMLCDFSSPGTSVADSKRKRLIRSDSSLTNGDTSSMTLNLEHADLKEARFVFPKSDLRVFLWAINRSIVSPCLYEEKFGFSSYMTDKL